MKRLGLVLLVLLIATTGACRYTDAMAPSVSPAPAAPATSATPAAVDLVKTMGLLAFAADAGLMSLSGDSQKDSLAMLQQLGGVAFPRIRQVSGRQYDVVWGPVATTGYSVRLSENIVINAMYLARERGTSNYVIGIAGTDARSFYDWAIQDLDIRPVAWPYAVGAGNVSSGSMAGLQKLQAMKPFPQTMQQGVSLVDALAALATQPVTIYVAGHSLGGALCEVVAMWLSDTRASWDPGRNATIIPMSFAGPTPGDSGWVGHFDASFRNSGTARVWNTNDVVPHAWNRTTMAELEGLYPQSPPTEVEKVAIRLAVAEADGHDYQQVLGGGTPFTGRQYQGITKFSEQAVLQHICAYYSYFGVPAPDPARCPC